MMDSDHQAQKRGGLKREVGSKEYLTKVIRDDIQYKFLVRTLKCWRQKTGYKMREVG